MSQVPPHRDDGRKWFHVTISTYGSWLPGDERGFRTLHHRLHVEGDYKAPPPAEEFETIRDHARRVMKHPRRLLSKPERAIIGQAILEKFETTDAFVLCLAVATTHVHILVKMRPDDTRSILGLVKGNAYHQMHLAGHPEKLWAKRFLPRPITGLRHLRAAYKYILRHEQEGGWIWMSEIECP